MSLNHDQKKFVKDNVRNLPPKEMAQRLQISENEVLDYLKERWRDDKYKRYIASIQNPHSQECPPSVSSFSFKNWIKNVNNIGAIIFLVILVIGVYMNGIHAVFLSDDFGIVQNKRIGDIHFVLEQPTSFLRPLLYLIAYKIGGLQPELFRMINIFMHTGSTILVYIIFSLMVGLPFAFFGATLFAVHPMLAESVTWISGGPYSTYTLFFLLSLLFYMLSIKGKKYYIGSIIFFLLSVVSSVLGVAMSAGFLLYEFCFGNIKKNWLKVVPYLVISIIWFTILIPFLSQRISVQKTQFYQEVQVQNPLTQIPIAITSYIQLYIWPDKLTLYHSELSFPLEEYIIRVILSVIFVGITLYFYKKNKYIFFWLSLFFISLAPTLSPLTVAWVVAERYVYLGTIGLVFCTAYFFYWLSKKKEFKTIAYIVFSFIIIALAIRTIVRNVDWLNEDNLWIATAKTSPSSPNTHNNMGDVYTRHGDFVKAAEEFKMAIKIKPNYADAYHNLGNAYRQMGKDKEALASYEKAAEMNPRLWQTHQNLAALYFSMGNIDAALKQIQTAININDANVDLKINEAIVYMKIGRLKEAEQILSIALAQDPNNETAKKIMAEVKASKK
ncbi:MAG: tetratricopeptide repeat protein [bacterium]|nr:tetratricopeptide repeat protein [bacterium]